MQRVTAPSTHRVVACRGGDVTELETRRLDLPGDGELLLRLRVVGLCGTDLFKLDTGATHDGMVLGHELVGEVVAMGDGISSFAMGDRVVVPHHVPCGECLLCLRGSDTMCEVFRENLLSPGGFAEYVLVRARAVRQGAQRIPPHIHDEAAVFVEPAACVLRGVHRAQIPGDGVCVVLGAGSMGLLHLLVLRARCPEVRVVMVDPQAERRAFALSLGAAGAASPGTETESVVTAMTDGLGADAIFDTVGGTAVLAAALSLTRQGGSVVLFAHAPDGQRADFDLNTLFKYERRVLGTYSGALTEQQEIFALLEQGRFDPTPLVSHRLPLDRFEHGVALSRAREALKVLYTFP
ncbi:MAG: alcohol dehydrogenase catalytic domain-containing protein [Chromatiales bacterium]|jgi:L-iditol 2-dehydrogenase|nr:alcohol dehydrogenase catalytic domain-containing protein [Chromatiales bacterium]